MRVLHALRDLSCNGGVQRLVVDLACSCPADTPVEVMVYHRDDGPEYIDGLRQAGIAVHVVPRWNLWRQWQLVRRADIVHAHLFPALYAVALLRPGSVYTEHNTTNRRRQRAWLRPLERWAYARFGAVTCISPAVRDALQAFLGPGRQDNTQVIYNGVNRGRLAAASERARQSPRAPGFHIAMVGSLTAKKDQATLIEALRLLPADVQLHLAGVGPREAELRAQADALGLGRRVHFLGVVTDVAGLLGGMDLYVQSSHWEGFGLAAVEAMACGLPTLCADVPGLNNLASERRLLFARGDAAALAALCQRVRDDAGFRAALLRAAEATAQAFSIESTGRALQALYRRLAAGSVRSSDANHA